MASFYTKSTNSTWVTSRGRGGWSKSTKIGPVPLGNGSILEEDWHVSANILENSGPLQFFFGQVLSLTASIHHFNKDMFSHDLILRYTQHIHEKTYRLKPSHSNPQKKRRRNNDANEVRFADPNDLPALERLEETCPKWRVTLRKSTGIPPKARETCLFFLWQGSFGSPVGRHKIRGWFFPTVRYRNHGIHHNGDVYKTNRPYNGYFFRSQISQKRQEMAWKKPLRAPREGTMRFFSVGGLLDTGGIVRLLQSHIELHVCWDMLFH